MSGRSFAPVVAPVVFGVLVLAAGALLSREPPRTRRVAAVGVDDPHPATAPAVPTAIVAREAPAKPAARGATPALRSEPDRETARREESARVVAMELREDAREATRTDPLALPTARASAEGETTPDDFAAR